MFKIKQKHMLAFKIWLALLGYQRTDLADGGATFKGKGTKLDYVLIDSKMSGNSACQKLYEEFKVHLVSPELADKTNSSLAKMVESNVFGKVA